MRKHVLMLLSNGFNPDPRVYKEAKSLIDHGFKVSLICWDRDCNLKLMENIDGIDVYRVRTGNVVSGNFKSMLFNIFKFHKKAFDLSKKIDFDVVHSHDFDTVMVGYILKKKFKVPLVYDIHDLYYTWFSSYSKVLKFLSWTIKKLDIYYAKKADHIITVTESIGLKQSGLKEYYMDNGILEEKITVIWNYPLEKIISIEKAVKNKKITICYIGNIRSFQNFEMLFSAIKNKGQEKYRVLIVGSGPFIDRIKKLSLEKNINVKFIGRVPNKEVYKCYSQSDISYSVLAQRENDKRAVSVKTFDAAYCGIPIICINDTLDADFVKKYNLGETCDFTLEGISYALDKIKPITAKKFTWEEQEPNLIKVYEGLF